MHASFSHFHLLNSPSILLPECSTYTSLLYEKPLPKPDKNTHSLDHKFETKKTALPLLALCYGRCWRPCRRTQALQKCMGLC